MAVHKLSSIFILLTTIVVVWHVSRTASENRSSEVVNPLQATELVTCKDTDGAPNVVTIEIQKTVKLPVPHIDDVSKSTRTNSEVTGKENGSVPYIDDVSRATGKVRTNHISEVTGRRNGSVPRFGDVSRATGKVGTNYTSEVTGMRNGSVPHIDDVSQTTGKVGTNSEVTRTRSVPNRHENIYYDHPRGPEGHEVSKNGSHEKTRKGIMNSEDVIKNGTTHYGVPLHHVSNNVNGRNVVINDKCEVTDRNNRKPTIRTKTDGNRSDVGSREINRSTKYHVKTLVDSHEVEPEVDSKIIQTLERKPLLHDVNNDRNLKILHSDSQILPHISDTIQYSPRGLPYYEYDDDDDDDDDVDDDGHYKNKTSSQNVPDFAKDQTEKLTQLYSQSAPRDKATQSYSHNLPRNGTNDQTVKMMNTYSQRAPYESTKHVETIHSQNLSRNSIIHEVVENIHSQNFPRDSTNYETVKTINSHSESLPQNTYRTVKTIQNPPHDNKTHQTVSTIHYISQNLKHNNHTNDQTVKKINSYSQTFPQVSNIQETVKTMISESPSTGRANDGIVRTITSHSYRFPHNTTNNQTIKSINLNYNNNNINNTEQENRSVHENIETETNKKQKSLNNEPITAKPEEIHKVGDGKQKRVKSIRKHRRRNNFRKVKHGRHLRKGTRTTVEHHTNGTYQIHSKQGEENLSATNSGKHLRTVQNGQINNETETSTIQSSQMMTQDIIEDENNAWNISTHEVDSHKMLFNNVADPHPRRHTTSTVVHTVKHNQPRTIKHSARTHIIRKTIQNPHKNVPETRLVEPNVEIGKEKEHTANMPFKHEIVVKIETKPQYEELKSEGNSNTRIYHKVKNNHGSTEKHRKDSITEDVIEFNINNTANEEKRIDEAVEATLGTNTENVRERQAKHRKHVQKESESGIEYRTNSTENGNDSNEEKYETDEEGAVEETTRNIHKKNAKHHPDTRRTDHVNRHSSRTTINVRNRARTTSPKAIITVKRLARPAIIRPKSNPRPGRRETSVHNRHLNIRSMNNRRKNDIASEKLTLCEFYNYDEEYLKEHCQNTTIQSDASSNDTTTDEIARSIDNSGYRYENVTLSNGTDACVQSYYVETASLESGELYTDIIYMDNSNETKQVVVYGGKM